jgi:cytidine deaminase
MAFNAIRRVLETLGEAASGKIPDAAKEHPRTDEHAAGAAPPPFAEMYRSIGAAFAEPKDAAALPSFLAARASRDAGWSSRKAGEGRTDPSRSGGPEYERQVMSAAPYCTLPIGGADMRREVMADPAALFAAARNAMRQSHSPYSTFPVGAAILSESGAIYSGCNIENAAFPEGWCAETSAIAHMVVAGDRRIVEIAVVSEKMPKITPCGGCRQRILEFGSADTRIHLCDANGVVESLTLAELLPRVF